MIQILSVSASEDSNSFSVSGSEDPNSFSVSGVYLLTCPRVAAGVVVVEATRRVGAVKRNQVGTLRSAMDEVS